MNFRYFVCLTLISLNLFANDMDRPIYIPNVHTVIEGELYRSATLKSNHLEQLLINKNIKTILNLRGASDGLDWFEQEKAIAENLGIKLINIPMSASRLPHREDLLRLIESFEHDQGPFLVHCMAGADRTGEAVAMYMMDYKAATKKEALSHLDPKYFHIPILTPAKTYFIKNIYRGKEWAKKHYDPCSKVYPFYSHALYCNEDDDLDEDPFYN